MAHLDPWKTSAFWAAWTPSMGSGTLWSYLEFSLVWSFQVVGSTQASYFCLLWTLYISVIDFNTYFSKMKAKNSIGASTPKSLLYHLRNIGNWIKSKTALIDILRFKNSWALSLNCESRSRDVNILKGGLPLIGMKKPNEISVCLDFTK